ncbi:MAG: deoxyguanosinetriphosphate triphosphohydrolase [Beijerinckiaceae bacterium]
MLSQSPPLTLRPGERWTAVCASDPWASRGRLTPEPSSATRTEFQRDRDRIIHSTAFRRLKHKTQVFLAHEGDHYRTRLTHTIEVAQIARSLGRALGLDEDLAETLALAHDLGHTPFGHAGERALARAAASHGGFDHNAQSLRVVTALERRYAAFDGLNLTWETLEGLVKHNGPLTDREGRPITKHGLPGPIASYDRRHPLELWSQASAEAQAAAIADDIAYNAHDIDDGLRAGLLSFEELGENPFLAGLLREIRSRHPGLDLARVTHELQRRIITSLVEDVIAESRRRLALLVPKSVADVRAAPTAVVAFSAAMQPAVESLRAFLYPKLYRHPKVIADMDAAERMVEDLYAAFIADPELMPVDWARDAAALGDTGLARRVSDYIAGMTDLYAAERHRRVVAARV